MQGIQTCERVSHHIQKIASNQRTSSAQLINEQNTASLSKQSNDIINSLVFKRVRRADSDLFINCWRIVLDGRYTRHLNRRLEGACNEEAAERGSVGEQFYV